MRTTGRSERAVAPIGDTYRTFSYAVLRTCDQAAVTAAVSSLRDGDPVELSFDGVGLFRRGRACVLAGVTSQFVARQERVVSAVPATGANLRRPRSAADT